MAYFRAEFLCPCLSTCSKTSPLEGIGCPAFVLYSNCWSLLLTVQLLVAIPVNSLAGRVFACACLCSWESASEKIRRMRAAVKCSHASIPGVILKSLELQWEWVWPQVCSPLL